MRVFYRFLDLPGYRDLVVSLIDRPVPWAVALLLGGPGRPWSRTAPDSGPPSTSWRPEKRAWLPFAVAALAPICVLGVGFAGRAAFAATNQPLNPPESTTHLFQFYRNRVAASDFSSFGPSGALLIVPIALLWPLALRRDVDRRRLAPASSVLVYVVALAVAYRFNQWVTRFLLTPVALIVPLLAYVYRYRPFAAGCAVVAAGSLAVAHAFNNERPTGLAGDEAPVWTMTRTEALTLSHRPMRAVVEAIEARSVPDARIGAALGRDAWSYPRFGPSLGREVV